MARKHLAKVSLFDEISPIDIPLSTLQCMPMIDNLPSDVLKWVKESLKDANFSFDSFKPHQIKKQLVDEFEFICFKNSDDFDQYNEFQLKSQVDKILLEREEEDAKMAMQLNSAVNLNEMSENDENNEAAILPFQQVINSIDNTQGPNSINTTIVLIFSVLQPDRTFTSYIWIRGKIYLIPLEKRNFGQIKCWLDDKDLDRFEATLASHREPPGPLSCFPPVSMIPPQLQANGTTSNIQTVFSDHSRDHLVGNNDLTNGISKITASPTKSKAINSVFTNNTSTSLKMTIKRQNDNWSIVHNDDGLHDHNLPIPTNRSDVRNFKVVPSTSRPVQFQSKDKSDVKNEAISTATKLMNVLSDELQLHGMEHLLSTNYKYICNKLLHGMYKSKNQYDRLVSTKNDMINSQKELIARLNGLKHDRKKYPFEYELRKNESNEKDNSTILNPKLHELLKTEIKALKDIEKFDLKSALCL